jgi:hypothetical protein
MLAVLRDPAASKPAPGRTPYLLSPILFPAAPPETEIFLRLIQNR